jgi:hypothetical protein
MRRENVSDLLTLFKRPGFGAVLGYLAGGMANQKNNAIPSDSFARCVLFAISQPENVDVNEILFRPTVQEL